MSAPADLGPDTTQVPSTGSVMTRPPRAVGAPTPQRLSIAVSDLRTFKQCPRRYEYQRRWRLPARVDVQSWYGLLVHGVLRTTKS